MADNWQLKAVISANAAGMLSALSSVNKMSKTTRKYLSDLGSSASNLAGSMALPLGLVSGAMAGLSIAGIQQAIMGFARLGDEVNKSATRIGISTDEYQRIAYVAGQSGVAADQLGAAMGRLNKGIAEAASGKNQELAALLAKAGISMRGANGELRAATDLLPEVADLFARNKNAAMQARMGNALYGKSWQTLAPLLNGGRKGIEELTARYKMLGLNISKEAIEAGEKLGDQLDDLRLVTKSYSDVIASKLLPVLSPLIEQTIRWAAANRDMITTKVSAFLADLTNTMAKVDWSSIIKGARDFAAGARDLINWLGGAQNALIAFVAFINASTLLALGSLTGALGRAAFAFGGMAFAAYAAGNAAMLSMLRTAIVALSLAGPIGAIRAAFAWMAGGVAASGGIMAGAMGLVKLAIRGIGRALMANPLGVLLGLATAAVLIYQNWGTLKEWFGTFFSWIGDKFQALVGWAVDLAKAAGSVLGLGGGNAAVQAAALASTAADAPPMPGAAPRPSLVAPAARARVDGQVNININGLPQGSRVEQVAGSGTMPLNLSAGYSGSALGLPH